METNLIFGTNLLHCVLQTLSYEFRIAEGLAFFIQQLSHTMSCSHCRRTIGVLFSEASLL
jgi:hypothetical protein